jgi:hypothetical protein
VKAIEPAVVEPEQERERWRVGVTKSEREREGKREKGEGGRSREREPAVVRVPRVLSHHRKPAPAGHKRPFQRYPSAVLGAVVPFPSIFGENRPDHVFKMNVK